MNFFRKYSVLMYIKLVVFKWEKIVREITLFLVFVCVKFFVSSERFL